MIGVIVSLLNSNPRVRYSAIFLGKGTRLTHHKSQAIVNVLKELPA
ncbi:hypothetical protein OPW36_20695 [Vibrio europaeus]|nr:hypothetical protein [Vibrio europaeus]MDC5804772.1 hypothetical protein [Vibrio europaeus]MDC5811922.1 hypothetical protein [Vibrio europaeus]MDC5827153.1 hypothetical protein [Vibrio europaeus]MDC5832519.1 hypothetical protein [Vibrio europaeus]MDC5835474.1 hypothetical protein [Vibrio europaeus]